MLQHSRDSNRFLNTIKNITATDYYNKGTTNQRNQPTNQSTNQMIDTNLQQELRIYSIPLNVSTISNET
jgi:hypothetical protein